MLLWTWSSLFSLPGLSSVSISIIPCPSVKFTCFGMSRDSLSACYFLFYFDSP